MTENEAQGKWMLPDGWVLATLGEVADTTRKRRKPQEHPELRFIGMEHVEAHTMRLLGTVPASEMRSTAEYFEPGDVLYGRLRPYLNKVLCPDFEGLSSAEFVVFRQVPYLESKYILYFLNSWDFVSFASHLNEGDRPRVNFDQLAPYPFPLAPLPEQRRIVGEIETQFTRLDAGVAALERAQANLKRYRASVLKAACEGRLVPTEAELARTVGARRDAPLPEPPPNEPPLPYEPADQLLVRILTERRARWEAENPGKKYKEPAPPDVENLPELPEGWCWASLDQLTWHITSGSRGWAKYYSNKGSIFIRAQDIKTDDLVLDDVAHVDLPGSVEGTRTKVCENDLLITITGANVTKTALVHHQMDDAYVSQHVGLVRPVTGKYGQYLYYSTVVF